MKKKDFVTFNDFIIRSPIRPLHHLFDLPTDLPSFFKSQLRDDLFLNNLILASPALYERAIKWREEGLKNSEDETKLHLSLLKYWIRMCTRCTPFGGFAGVAPGKIGDETTMVWESVSEHSYSSRLDMNFLSELVAHLNHDRIIREKIAFFPSNSLFRISDHYRFVEFTIEDGFRNYIVSEVPVNEYLDIVLSLSKKGATIQELQDALVALGNDAVEAREYLEECIECKILVSELEPRITGDDYLSTLIKRLQEIAGGQSEVEQLKRIHNELSSNKLLDVSAHNRIKKDVSTLLPDFNGKDLVQTDLHLKGQSLCLDKLVADEIVDSAMKIFSIGSGRKEFGHMGEFIHKFRERFEGKEVLLAHALDAEAGIGYADFTNESTDKPPLLIDLDIVRNENSDSASISRLKDFQSLKLFNALFNNEDEIIITDNDIDSLAKGQVMETNFSMYIFGALLKAPEQKNGFRFVLHNMGGPSAAVYLGRFCNGNEELNHITKGYLIEEEEFHEGSILAEIVHQPHSRTGNVISRPVLRKYEIPYITLGNVEDDFQIPITDLYVSLRGDELILKSKRLNKRVYPRLSNAHNPDSRSLPIYKFLTDFQFHNVAHRFFWNWGTFNYYPYLPRVSYKNIILCHAQWFLKANEHTDIKKMSAEELLSYFKTFRSRNKIPRYIILTEGDNQLVLDLENASCLIILRSELFKKGSVYLREFLMEEQYCYASDRKGNKFTSEIILPIKKNMAGAGDPRSPASSNVNTSVKRSFIPGSNWMFLKIYCGTKTAERVLKEVISDLVNNSDHMERFNQWFFIRYNDTDHHLRIRFNLTDNSFATEILSSANRLLDRFIKDGLVYRVQLDTYHREIERYGEKTMELSEAIFHYDSISVLGFIQLIVEEEHEKYRWLIALRAIDMFLDDAGYKLEDKYDLARIMEKNFSNEFVNNEIVRKQMKSKYRNASKSINSILDPCEDQFNDIEDAIALFADRSRRIRPLFQQIRGIMATDRPGTPSMNDLVSSYIHMFINRVFESNQRKQEWVLYSFLAKFYSSKIAIKNKL